MCPIPSELAAPEFWEVQTVLNFQHLDVNCNMLLLNILEVLKIFQFLEHLHLFLSFFLSYFFFLSYN